MILADTSVWVDHFRQGNATLASLLEPGEVAMHPFVIGELACGNLRARRQLLPMLEGLPAVATLTHDEALDFLHARTLHGHGLGWIDLHLLGSAALTGIPLWTLDRPLAAPGARWRRVAVAVTHRRPGYQHSPPGARMSARRMLT